jgi:hypothetical protein
MEAIKVFGVWTVGLAVLLGTTGASLARPKKPGVAYCVCTCDTTPGTGIDAHDPVLNWEQKAGGCALNGRTCTREYDGKKGVLTNCNVCIGQADGSLGRCSPASPSVAPPRPQAPKVPPTRPSQPPSTVR